MYTTIIEHMTLSAALLILGSGAALAAPEVQTLETDIGEVIADSEGFVVYTLRNDEEGVSSCYDQCATNWPPFFAEEGAEEGDGYTLVERTDGTLMWAK